jgi:hypothetical protein
MVMRRRDDPETRAERLDDLLEEFRTAAEQHANTHTIIADLRDQAKALARQGHAQAATARERARSAIIRNAKGRRTRS